MQSKCEGSRGLRYCRVIVSPGTLHVEAVDHWQVHCFVAHVCKSKVFLKLGFMGREAGSKVCILRGFVGILPVVSSVDQYVLTDILASCGLRTCLLLSDVDLMRPSLALQFVFQRLLLLLAHDVV